MKKVSLISILLVVSLIINIGFLFFSNFSRKSVVFRGGSVGGAGSNLEDYISANHKLRKIDHNIVLIPLMGGWELRLPPNRSSREESNRIIKLAKNWMVE